MPRSMLFPVIVSTVSLGAHRMRVGEPARILRWTRRPPSVIYLEAARAFPVAWYAYPEERRMDRFRDRLRRVWTWATVPPARDLQRGDGPVARALLWLVALPYFAGSAIYCGVLLLNRALGWPFTADAAFAALCAVAGVLLSGMTWWVVRSGLAARDPVI